MNTNKICPRQILAYLHAEANYSHPYLTLTSNLSQFNASLKNKSFNLYIPQHSTPQQTQWFFSIATNLEKHLPGEYFGLYRVFIRIRIPEFPAFPQTPCATLNKLPHFHFHLRTKGIILTYLSGVLCVLINQYSSWHFEIHNN